MHEDLTTAVDELMPRVRDELEQLVRIDSVSAANFDPQRVRDSATAAAGLLEDAGYEGARLLELDDAHPGVFAEFPAPPGAPTVLLYAHHDVQPAGPEELWNSPAFEPVEVEGRLFGRGSADDKCGIVSHTASLRAFDGKPPVGLKVFLEGEEEIGSAHLDGFLEKYQDDLASDAIVIADAGTWKVGEPGLTTSLRGLVDCTVEVRTLQNGVHSGMWGGVFPDALTALIKVLATLHDDRGNVAIDGLHRGSTNAADHDESEAREQSGVLDGVQMIGDGPIVERLAAAPSATVLAIDAPPLSQAINQLLPSATAKVSVRLAPGEDPDRAMDNLVAHLEANVPWGAQVTVTRGSAGHPFELDTSGPAYDAFRTGFQVAHGRQPVDIGVGGSIPFVKAFSDAYPNADILLTGASDPLSAIHAPNESVHLGELRDSTLAQVVALAEMAR